MKVSSIRLKPWDRPYFIHLLAGLLLSALGALFLACGITPTHDAIGSLGLYHFYFDGMVRGVPPYWNPYSQAGTPFYPYWQGLGLSDPLTYAFVLVQKLTGCGTLATFIFHYLFQYFLFVVGSYHAFRALTEDHRASVLFALILMLAVFPAVMHQVMMLIPFYLWPFITWAFLGFFQAQARRKGPWLFLVVSLCAAACLTYIPSYLVFYVVFFIALALALGLADARQVRAIVGTRRGLLWMAASALAAALIVAPVVALAVDMRPGSELFPLARVMLHHGIRLPISFASDSAADVFSERTQTWMSITLANLVGLAFQPQRRFWGLDLWRPEAGLYVGLLPLACAAYFALRARKRSEAAGWLMLGLAAALLLVMCSFAGPLDRGLAQRLLVAIIPTLRKVETFEVFANPFLFCLLAAGAAGYVRAKRDAGPAFWMSAAAAVAAKLAWYAAVTGLRVGELQLGGPGRSGASLALAGALLGGFFWAELGAEPGRRARRYRTACVILALADLLWFDAVHVQAFDAPSIGEGEVVETRLYDSLKHDGLIPPKREQGFAEYREAFSQYCAYSLVGREMMAGTKVAMPAVFNRYLSGCVDLDNGFSTRRYYDYLVHVDLPKQLITSSVTSPIINFFPRRDAVFVADERAAIAEINRSNADALRRRVFIETGAGASDPPRAPPGPTAYLEPTREQLLALLNPAPRLPARAGFRAQVLSYDANRLSVAVTAPEDGYLYYGDGYDSHWRASVDGRAEPILKADVNFKSVTIPRGSHRVDFAYEPRLIRLGLGLGAVGDALALAVLALLFARGVFAGAPNKHV